jgi:hypothetical protein
VLRLLGWIGGLIGVTASIVGLWGAYFAPEALPVYPPTVIDACSEHGGDNDRFLRDMFPNVAKTATVKRIVYFRSLSFREGSASPWDTEVECPNGTDGNIFYHSSIIQGAITGENVTYYLSFGEGYPPTAIINWKYPRDTFEDAALVESKWFATQKIISIYRIDTPDSQLLERMDCTRRKLRYLDTRDILEWRASLACILPTSLLDLFG